MDRPVQLMHIAKTAGSYVNAVFARALGEDRVVLHAEVRLGNGDQVAEALARGVRFFSGHIYHPHWARLWPADAPEPLRFVTLRDPIDQLASHILWLDHYAMEEFREEYRALSPGLQRLVDRIAATDLTNGGELDRLMTHLPPEGVQMLDNCQSRYFLCGGDAAVSKHDALTLDHTRALRRAVESFDLVIRQDALAAGLARAAELTGVALQPPDKRINPARSPRRINTAGPTIRAILSKRSLVDQWLWRHTAVAAADQVAAPRTEAA